MNDSSAISFDELLAQAKDLHQRLDDFDKVKQQLSNSSDNHELIDAVLKQFKKEYYEQKRKEGLAKISLGAIVILAGFLITCFNFHANQSFTFAMYGLTSIGICIVFWGLYKIIG